MCGPCAAVDAAHVRSRIPRPTLTLSIQAKLLAAFGLVVALMLAVGLFAVSRLHSDNRHLSQLARVVVPSTRAVGDINALMNKYRKDQLHYIVAKPSDRPLGVDGSIAGDLADDRALMRRSLHDYRATHLVEDRADRRLLDAFEANFARYVAITSGFVPLADAGKRFRASELVGAGPGDAQWDRLKALIGAWNNHKVTTAHAAAAASRSSYDLSALAVAVAIVLARRMTRAVREIGSAAKAISLGDIDQRVVARSRDEFGEMARDFESMIDYLRSTVGVAEAIADGDLAVEVEPRSKRDALGNSLAAMTASLRRLVSENEGLLAASQEEANTDALTGLPNRRALMRDLEAGVTHASEERPLVLTLFDLDGFKQYNDTFGHPAGDNLLSRLGDRLHQAMAGSGTAYRMGGDEFCVLATTEGDGGSASAARPLRSDAPTAWPACPSRRRRPRARCAPPTSACTSSRRAAPRRAARARTCC